MSIIKITLTIASIIVLLPFACSIVALVYACIACVFLGGMGLFITYPIISIIAILLYFYLKETPREGI